MDTQRTRPCGCLVLPMAVLAGALLLAPTPAAVAQQVLARPTAASEPMPLKQLLARWEQQYNSTFAYASEVVQDKLVVLPPAGPFEEQLAQVLSAAGLEFKKLRDHYYVIKPAAARAVTGRVTQPGGEPLPGVTVVVQGHNTGTSTDADGRFQLSVPLGSKLLFSSVGFVRQEVAVLPADRPLAVVLADDRLALHEVVVVGYGRQQRATVTGAIASLDSMAFRSRVVTNPLSALQGTIPGVIVTRTSGRPGQEGWDVRVRGVSSVNSTPPLVVVDGVPYGENGALSSLNPNDIATIDVLKDASAAIYGSRAANGVILITTKQGAAGKPVVSYNATFALKTVGRARRFTDLTQWYEMYNESQVNNNNPNHLYKPYESYFLHPTNDVVTPGVSNTADLGFFTSDVQQELFGTGRTQQHNLAIAGRAPRAGYYASVGYTDDGSVLRVGNNSNQKYNARVNTDFLPTPELKISNQLVAERQVRVEPTALNAVLGAPGGVQPGYAFYTRDGTRPYGWGASYQSPLALATQGGSREQRDTRLSEQVQAEWSLGKHLTVNGAAAIRYTLTGIDTRTNHIDFYNYAGTAVVNAFGTGNDYNSLRRDSQEGTYQSYYGNVLYRSSLGPNHHLSLMAGASEEKNAYNAFWVKVNNLAPGLDNIGQGMPLANATDARGGTKLAWALVSYFGRATYDYLGKYLFEGIARYDGSSSFTAQNNHRWKFFPAVSAGWVISNEKFLQNQRVLNHAKLRASLGVTGNQAGIGIYDYVALVNNHAGAYPFGGGGLVSTPTTTVGNIVALDRTWEQVVTRNLGLDVGLLDSRLTGSVDVYAKHNRNMLIAGTYPATIGGTPPLTNDGDLTTQGWEAALTWTGKAGALGYSITGIFSDNHTLLNQVGGTNAVELSGSTASPSNVTQNVRQYPYNSYFGYVYDGIIQNQEELLAYKARFAGGGLPAGIGIGDARYKDLNGDGKLDQAFDLTYLGNTNPRYAYSTRLNLTWKGFDFALLLQGIGRHDVFRQGSFARPSTASLTNLNAYFYHRTWSPDRPDATYPRLSASTDLTNYNYRASALTIRNNYYLRLKNVVLGYTLPTAATQVLHLSSVRVYFSGENLAELVGLKDGYDPEVADDPDAFPFYRYWAFGLNASF